MDRPDVTPKPMCTGGPSAKYVIRKDRTGVLSDFPWCFEGDQWGDTGSCATFEEAIAATVGWLR